MERMKLLDKNPATTQCKLEEPYKQAWIYPSQASIISDSKFDVCLSEEISMEPEF